jgi:LPS-assembly protein
MYKGHLGLNYRFELASDSLSSQRHELDAYASLGRVQLNTRYFYAKALEDTSIEENRQQLDNSVGLKVAENWTLRAGALHDLGNDSGLRRATLGADFTGCCVAMSLTAVRNLTNESSGDAGTDIIFRMGLKGLGGYPEGK